MNHAVHPSPYDETCPTCVGMDDPTPDARDWSRTAAVLCFLAAVALVLAAVIAQKEMS